MAVLPKIVYNFNEPKSVLVQDYSENGNIGTKSGTNDIASSRVGRDLLLTANTDNIDLGNIEYLNGASEMAIHLGIQFNASTGTRKLIHKSNQIDCFYNYTTNIFTFDLFLASGTATVNAPLTIAQFYDIDISHEGDVLTLYIDGVSIDTDSTQSGVISTNTNNLYIGYDLTTSSVLINLNEFKLYNEAITTDIIDSVILNPNGVVSDNGLAPEFEIGDVIFTDYDSTPKYAVVSYVEEEGSQYRILPLTSGILSGNIFKRGGHLWDTTRQQCFKIDKAPSIKFYDGVSKSSEIFLASKETYSLGIDGNDSSKFRLIDRKEALPTAISNVITLLDGYTYYFTTDIDLTGDRLDTNGVVSIIASSPEVGSILSTGLAASTALLTSEHTIAINNIGLNHTTAIDLDATANANQAIDWFGVNFVNCTTAIGTIKNYGNAIFNTIGFLNSGGLTFDGSLDTIAFTGTIFQNATALTSIILPSTLTVTRRFRIDNSSFISLSGETALNVSLTATIPNEGYILTNVNFAGGGTYLTGVQSTDNKARFSGCRGINNSSNIAQYYMQGNATSTTIASSGTFVKIAGTTTTGSYVEKFDVTTTDNKAIYTGSLTGFYKVHVISACTSGNNKELEVAIYKNGAILTPSRSKGTTSGTGKAENLACQDIVELETDDYIEIYITNNTGTTNITVEDLNVTIIRLN